MSTTGTVFNIQRFSIHDGPGIRTTVFFKGCPLRCFWCHNPEGLRRPPEIRFFPSRCIGCGECAEVCEQTAHTFADGIHSFDRSRCVTCGRCAEICCTEALEMVGQEKTIDEVMDEVLRDRIFYETSNGGVTLSGGEPLLQREFTLELLQRCHAEGLHTAVETSAHCRWEDLAELLPVTDMFMLDIKHMDEKKHREATGMSNQLILANIRHLVKTAKPIVFRTPVIPGVNDSPEDISAIAGCVRELTDLRASEGVDPDAAISLELLAFHRLAGDKYRSLDMQYEADGLESPSKEQMIELVELAKSHGIPVRGR